jgi:hypothetical protein
MTSADHPPPLGAEPSRRVVQPWPARAAPWAGVGLLCALTVATLILPAFYVWLFASKSTMDWQTNHADHLAAARVAMLMIAFPAGGAALGALPTLLPRRPVSAAARAAAMAAGAFTASLVLTVGGFLWILGHARLTF